MAGPKSHDGFPCKKKNTKGRAMCEDGGRDWVDVAVSQSPEDCQQPPSQERGLVTFSLLSVGRKRPCSLSLLGPVTEDQYVSQTICLTVLEAGKSMIKVPADYVSG